MAKLKVAEIFYSLQGEGVYLGTPSVFLRLFGCNFTCSGFGMPRGEKSEERLNIDPNEIELIPNVKKFEEEGVRTVDMAKKYQKYEDLPLVHTGCDSYASWDPRFKHLSPMLEVDEIVERILSLLPDRSFGFGSQHLIITGGEPLLLGWQKVLPELISKLIPHGLTNITFETNGTQELSKDFREYLMDLKSRWIEVVFSVSSKLGPSGEKWEDAIKPYICKEYMDCTRHGKFYFKWVIATEDDVEDVYRAIHDYKKVFRQKWDKHGNSIYVMPVGGTTEGYFLNNKRVAEIAMKNGWRYSPRLQVELWKNVWGT